jgi:tetratricopeptide (TPR) repeat protein
MLKTSNVFRIASGALLMLAAAQTFAADKPTVRPEVGGPLQEAQKALQAKNYKDAKAKIDQAEAVGKLTPYESYIVARLKSSAAIGTGDYKTALSAYDAVLASPELPAAEKLPTLDAYVKIAYASKDYGKTATAIKQYQAAGGNSKETIGLLAQSQYLAGQYKEASQTLTADIDEAEKAGQKPSDTQLQLLASCALKQNDMVAYTRALEKIVTYTPKKEYWLDLIVRTSKAGLLTEPGTRRVPPAPMPPTRWKRPTTTWTRCSSRCRRVSRPKPSSFSTRVTRRNCSAKARTHRVISA